MDNTFVSLLKKEITDNKKTIIITVCGIWGVFIIIGLFGGMMFGLGSAILMPAFAFISGLAFTIVASFAFSSMKTKEGRISELMLPASRFEKFFVRWLAVVPGMIIVVALAWIFGQLVCTGVEKIMQNTVSEEFWAIVGESTDLTSDDIAGLEQFQLSYLIWYYIANCLVSQACYFFGAILWPKLSFIKTLAAMQVIQIGLFVGAAVFEGVFGNFIDVGSLMFPSKTAMCIATPIICFALYWLTYWWYSRSQVIYKLF